MSDSNELARKKIFQWIAEPGRSRNMLAEKAGIGGSVLATFLSGGGATLKSLDAIAIAMGVKTSELISEQPIATTQIPSDRRLELIRRVLEMSDGKVESLLKQLGAGEFTVFPDTAPDKSKDNT
jgi:hypothetical protein